MRKGNLNNLIGLDLLLLAALGVTRAQIAFGAFDEKDVVTSPYAPDYAVVFGDGFNE